MSEKSMIFELRLYDNAIDFINKSMESYQRAINYDQPLEYKYSILFLATGSELILKSILETVHPLFIRENLDAKDNEKTLNAENLVSRINKVYSYNEPKKHISNQDDLNFIAIRKMRNNIIHKDVIFDNENNPREMYADTLFSLDRVVKQFKEKTLSGVVNYWDDIVKIKEIRNAYYKHAIGISINGLALPCGLCSIEKMVPVKSGGIKCLHCNHHYVSIVEAIFSLDNEEQKEMYIKSYLIEKNGSSPMTVK